MSKVSHSVARTASGSSNIKEAPLEPMHKVSYTFVFKTGNVKLPYAIKVDGVVDPAGSGTPKSARSGQAFSVMAKKGAKVSLYLNSDAQHTCRNNPVYEVTVGDADIDVTITEKTGKQTSTPTPVFKKAVSEKGKAATKKKNAAVGKVAADESKKADATPEKTIHYYEADLTGDIWMKVTHKYTEQEVSEILGTDVDEGISAAIKKIYAPLIERSVTATIAATDTSPAQEIELSFNDSDNPNKNINEYSLLADGLPRVHPWAYVAVFNAAKRAGVTAMTMSSAWRPMLGSIAHRCGLGIDISYIKAGSTKISINRQELVGKGKDVEWVSEAEKKLYADHVKARDTEAPEAQKLVKTSSAEYEAVKNDPVKVVGAKKKLDDAKAAKKAADQKVLDTKKAWSDERDANEPKGMREFRQALLDDVHVKELFDPWFMDSNTRDAKPGLPNVQETSNEQLHSNHLHATILETKIRQ